MNMNQKSNLFLFFVGLGLLCASPLLAYTTQGMAFDTSFQVAQQPNANSTPSPQATPITPEPNQIVTPTPPQSPQPTNPATSAPASSEASNEINSLYAQLQNALQQHDWQASDALTFQLMLSLAGPDSKAEGRFNLTEWANFSCADLIKIDTLWSEASRGRLGFSAQARILKATESRPLAFYSRIRWLFIGPTSTTWLVAWKYDPQTKQSAYLEDRSPNFTNPSEGHLPAMLVWAPQADGEAVDLRFQKIEQCGL
jgi:hypothetical protein